MAKKLAIVLALALCALTAQARHLSDAVPASVAELLKSTPEFSAFATAAEALGLLEALGPDFSGTVFVPVTPAYAKLAAALGVSSPADLLSDVQPATVGTAYHISPQLLTSADLKEGVEIETWVGQPITMAAGGKLVPTVGDQAAASVVKADIQVGQAIVHAIDGVMLLADSTSATLQLPGAGAAAGSPAAAPAVAPAPAAA